MEMTSGSPDIKVGVIDGPVALNHPDLAGRTIQQVRSKIPGSCRSASSSACGHGTFVLGMLAGKRDSVAPAICPDCTFLLRPIFSEALECPNGVVPSTSSEELATAIIDSVNAGAHVLNLSVNITQSSTRSDMRLIEALDFAGRRGTIVVAAAANEGISPTSALTRHAWVLPVIAADYAGRPLHNSQLSTMTGKRGIAAPGQEIRSLGANGTALTISGTSAATAFVSGVVALLRSQVPTATAAEVKFAVTRRTSGHRASLVPPMLDAWSAYQTLSGRHVRANDHHLI
jgi:subtilisin family serine protease